MRWPSRGSADGFVPGSEEGATIMQTSPTTFRSKTVRRAGAALGGVAIAVAVFVSTSVGPSTPTLDVDAHEKFLVITVIATPTATPAVTVTETDKPHQLQTPRAAPRIRAPRTVTAEP
jgi:hypothetical protein